MLFILTSDIDCYDELLDGIQNEAITAHFKIVVQASHISCTLQFRIAKGRDRSINKGETSGRTSLMKKSNNGIGTNTSAGIGVGAEIPGN